MGTSRFAHRHELLRSRTVELELLRRELDGLSLDRLYANRSAELDFLNADIDALHAAIEAVPPHWWWARRKPEPPKDPVAVENWVIEKPFQEETVVPKDQSIEDVCFDTTQDHIKECCKIDTCKICQKLHNNRTLSRTPKKIRGEPWLHASRSQTLAEELRQHEKTSRRTPTSSTSAVHKSVPKQRFGIYIESRDAPMQFDVSAPSDGVQTSDERAKTRVKKRSPRSSPPMRRERAIVSQRFREQVLPTEGQRPIVSRKVPANPHKYGIFVESRNDSSSLQFGSPSWPMLEEGVVAPDVNAKLRSLPSECASGLSTELSSTSLTTQAVGQEALDTDIYIESRSNPMIVDVSSPSWSMLEDGVVELDKALMPRSKSRAKKPESATRSRRFDQDDPNRSAGMIRALSARCTPVSLRELSPVLVPQRRAKQEYRPQDTIYIDGRDNSTNMHFHGPSWSTLEAGIVASDHEPKPSMRSTHSTNALRRQRYADVPAKFFEERLFTAEDDYLYACVYDKKYGESF